MENRTAGPGREITREEGIIFPRRGRHDPLLGPDVVLAMVPDAVRFLVQKTQGERLPVHDMALSHLYRPEGPMGERVSFAGPFLGAPQTVLAMEKLIVLGAKRFWVLGWCGSLQRFLRIGDVVIPTSAVSEEGTSGHYPVGKSPVEPDQDLTELLVQAVKGLPVESRAGAVWTTDAPYRETPAKVEQYSRAGVLGVEMEMSALMHVALFRSVALSGMLVVSDELFDLRWHTGFSSPTVKKVTREGAELFLDLILSMHQDVIGEEETIER
ncbi:MAG: nucleoside phosphorylase [Deltaproteobacteria bacterium]|nr:nucleoside phosphorylase [Deltaproteobacteria bacterium]